MLRVSSVKPKVISALILGTTHKSMASAKKMSLPSEVNLRNSSDIINTKLAKAGCGSVEVFCSVGLSF